MIFGFDVPGIVLEKNASMNDIKEILLKQVVSNGKKNIAVILTEDKQVLFEKEVVPNLKIEHKSKEINLVTKSRKDYVQMMSSRNIYLFRHIECCMKGWSFDYVLYIDNGVWDMVRTLVISTERT